MKSLIFKPRNIFFLYIIVTVAVCLHLLYLGVDIHSGHTWTTYNNYIIFKESFFHLISNKNLYILYIPDHWDLYKYSPTFALFMGSFAYLPDYLGMIGWNLLNTAVLFYGIRVFPFDDKNRSLLYLFLLFELIISLQGVQSNALMGGLILLSYGCFEKKQLFRAALWLTCASFIKIYGAVGFILFLFYPGKGRFIAYSAILAVAFFLLPLVVVTPQNLLWQYNNWAVMMGADHAASYGWSVMGWLHSWFGLNLKDSVIATGILLFFLPLLRRDLYGDSTFRQLFLASILIWVIIFNHKAESPTFIIAVTGVGIWYFTQPRAAWRTWLLFFVFVFTSLSHTDIFPPDVRKLFIYPYFIKAVPCIVLWHVIMGEMLMMKRPQTAGEALNA